MNALPQLVSTTTTSTAISDKFATPVTVATFAVTELWAQPEPGWHESVLTQFQEVWELQDGWDGFTAGPIRRDVVYFATQVLHQIMRPDTPAPWIVPMSHEGLSLEWHQHGIDLEIEIQLPGSLWVSFEDAVDGEPYEGPASTDLRAIASLIEKLTERHRDI